MTRWAGEMEFDFVEGGESSGQFVTTGKVVQFIRTHLARKEVEHAARLYEQSGGAVAAQLLEDAKSSSVDSQKALGDMFVMARDFATAAKCYEMGRRWADAARTYEQAADFASAARMFEKDGDKMRAAQALERAGHGAQALVLYEAAGAHEVMAECLARQGRLFEAASYYQRLGNVRGEVECLRLVPVADPGRVAAVKRLAALMAQYGHAQQAGQLIVETLRQIPAAQQDRELQEGLARILEGLGRTDQAQQIRAMLAGPQAAPPPPAPAAPTSVPFTRPAPAAAPKDPFATLSDPFGGGGGGGGGGAAPQVEAGPAPASSSDAYGFLKSIPIFGELNLQDMKDLYRLCEERDFPPGTIIIEQGVRGNGLTIILGGQVGVLRVDQGGATTPLATLGTGKYVGEISLVDDAPTSARVVASGPVRALFLPRERFEHFLYSRETAALRIYRLFTRTLAERLRQANLRR
ncbi:MAG: cyclic nucleotide-binding domain-containing protein [Deltaproteobacteria bacterium]|nr:cyclic nucleotide-binding domain-containing protein [Deltaproteobacteria bacterium]